jgi:hypothetical protein
MEHMFQKRGTGERNIQKGIAGRNARDASMLRSGPERGLRGAGGGTNSHWMATLACR